MLVVGAGLTGLTTAVLLARAGRSPVLVDAREAGSGTTGSSTAKASLLQGSVLQRLQHHAGPEVVSAYVRANRVGQLWLREELTTHGVPSQERQSVTYAVTPAGARLVEREAVVARRAGLPVVDVEDAGLPFPVLAAVGLPNQFQFDPLDVVEALRDEFRALGGTLVEGARVTEMSWSRPWRVSTAAGEVVADRVVLATQYPVPDRGMYFARLRADRSYAAAYRVQGPDVLPPGMYLSVDSPARSVRTAPDPEGDLLVVGGNGHETGRGGSTLARAADLDDWARRHFPVTAAGLFVVGAGLPDLPAGPERRSGAGHQRHAARGDRVRQVGHDQRGGGSARARRRPSRGRTRVRGWPALDRCQRGRRRLVSAPQRVGGGAVARRPGRAPPAHSCSPTAG